MWTNRVGVAEEMLERADWEFRLWVTERYIMFQY